MSNNKSTKDIAFKGHSVTKLINKTKNNLRRNGVKLTSKKIAIFIAKNTGIMRFVPVNYNKHISKSYIKEWFNLNKKSVTIVIPSYNDYKLLKRCIKSIRKTTDNSKVNIVVVDDYCEEKNRKKLLSLEKYDIKTIFRKSNGGFSKAVNDGIRASKNKDVILLNSDTEVKNGWLEALQFGAYKYAKGVGIVGAKLLYPNGTIQFAGTYRNTDHPDWFDHRYRGKSSSFGPANVPQNVLAITGACMYIKNSTIKTVGLFDEKFGMAFEDVDYCLRAWKKGLKSLYFPVSTVIHHESATRGKIQGKRELDSQKYFWEKWRSFFDERKVTNRKGNLRIIYVLKTTGVSGGIRMVFEHLNKLHDKGYDVELYSLDKDPDWTELRVKHKSFKNFELLSADLSKQEAIKVATWWETAPVVWQSSVVKGIPVFYVQDIETSYYPEDKRMQQVVLSNYKSEFNYLTISQWDQDELKKLGHESVNVGCGIDLDNFKPLKNVNREKDVLLALGRGEPLKNFSLTYKGWKRMGSSGPKLWLFGVEPDIVKTGERVKYFYKPTDERINELLNEATVFTQTSRHEGFCLTALEAMAAGTVVITTDSDGNRDYSRDGYNCLMIEQDNPLDMKNKLEKVFNDSKLQDKLRKGGYETAKKYGWPIITKKLESFYNNIGKIK